MATKETPHTEISEIRDIPELLRLAEEVQATKQARVLTRDGEDLVIVQPTKPARRRSTKGAATSAGDPLWDIVGMASSEGPGDVSEHVDKYLAEAYNDKHL